MKIVSIKEVKGKLSQYLKTAEKEERAMARPFL